MDWKIIKCFQNYEMVKTQTVEIYMCKVAQSIATFQNIVFEITKKIIRLRKFRVGFMQKDKFFDNS